MISFFAIVAVILLSTLLGSTIAWALAHTMLGALERRRPVLFAQQPVSVSERLESFGRSRILTP